MKKVSVYTIALLIMLLGIFNTEDSFSKPAEDETGEYPNWLERIDIGVDAGTDLDARFYFETVQPLYQTTDKEKTIFIQPRYSLENKNTVFNLGLGYRRLLDDNSLLLGVNSFFDYEDEPNHYRIGFGGEAFINQIELRTNTYIGLSPRRLIIETATIKEYEKAVDGIDAEIGIPLPHMNWIKLYGTGYWYNYQRFNNKEGWKFRTQVTPSDYFTLDFTIWDDNKGDTEYRVDARTTLLFGPADIKDNGNMFANVGFSEEAYPQKVDHSDKALDRVEREYRIEVERWIETVGAVVEVKRGN